MSKNEVIKKINTTTGLLIIFAVAVLVGGSALAYFYYAQPNEYDFEVQSSKPVEKILTVNTNYDTSSWQTFVNKKYGYELQLPPSWQDRGAEDPSKIIATSPNQFSQDNLIITGELPGAQYQISYVQTADSATYKKTFYSGSDLKLLGKIRIASGQLGDKYQTTDGFYFLIALNSQDILKISVTGNQSESTRFDAICSSLKLL